MSDELGFEEEELLAALPLLEDPDGPDLEGTVEGESGDGPDDDESSGIKPPKELEGPNAELAMQAMRDEHQSIMNALQNIR